MSKEWKGNKKSMSTMLGISTTRHPEERAAGDYYTTDPTAVRQFINHLQIDGKITEGIIWEPACGCGNISKELTNAGYNVFSTDLHDRGFGNSGIDFLQTFIKPLDCDTIITNPPYGERIAIEDLNKLYSTIGDRLKSFGEGKTAWLITSDFRAMKNIGLRPSRKIQLYNGALECRFLKFELYDGSKKAKYKNNQ